MESYPWDLHPIGYNDRAAAVGPKPDSAVVLALRPYTAKRAIASSANCVLPVQALAPRVMARRGVRPPLPVVAATVSGTLAGQRRSRHRGERPIIAFAMRFGEGPCGT
jgi:hypothetical protein